MATSALSDPGSVARVGGDTFQVIGRHGDVYQVTIRPADVRCTCPAGLAVLLDPPRGYLGCRHAGEVTLERPQPPADRARCRARIHLRSARLPTGRHTAPSLVRPERTPPQTPRQNNPICAYEDTDRRARLTDRVHAAKDRTRRAETTTVQFVRERRGCVRLSRGGRRQRRLCPRRVAIGRSAEPGAPAGSRPGRRTREHGGTAAVADADRQRGRLGRHHRPAARSRWCGPPVPTRQGPGRHQQHQRDGPSCAVTAPTTTSRRRRAPSAGVMKTFYRSSSAPRRPRGASWRTGAPTAPCGSRRPATPTPSRTPTSKPPNGSDTTTATTSTAPRRIAPGSRRGPPPAQPGSRPLAGRGAAR
jgi:hypothetical protein